MLRRDYPKVIWDDLKRQLGKVEKPARYTGGEIGARIKNPGNVTVLFALAFPDVYEVGMSHLGSHILYHVLNERSDVACERVYSPWSDMEVLLREKGWPLFTIENRIPLRDFDIVGFSLQYELTYTNVLAMLDLGGIPLRTSERTREDPLVIAGGPCAMAAEPLAEFIDAFALGDGEEVALEIVDTYKKWRTSGKRRETLLVMLSLLEGVYVPSLYRVDYNLDGTIKSIEPREILLPEDEVDLLPKSSLRYGNVYAAPRTVKRRVLKSLEDAPFLDRPLIPLLEPVHDRAMVEIFRGCTRGCRFCQAGMLYRPVREKNPETVERLAREILARSGYDEISLVSLSSADYSHIKEVVQNLLLDQPCGARISLPSLRVDSFSVDLAEMLAGSPKAGLTLAPEAGSQRIRDAINKKVTEEEILEAARRAFSLGFTHIKFYFMIGLPGETDEDVLAIARLADRVRKTGRDAKMRPTIVVSVSGFVPKAHTPFQWEPLVPPDELLRRQWLLRNALRGPGLEYRYHEAWLTKLEAVFARGDRRLGRALEIAFEKGERFDSWPEKANPDLWEEAFGEAGVDPDFYSMRERAKEEVFPWDHLSSGVRKSYLWLEREKAKKGIMTPDCREGLCTGCGVCPDLEVAVKIAEKEVAKQ